MNECPEPTPARNKTNDELDWDDDNFEPTEIEFANNPKMAQENDDTKAETDDWLAPLNCDTKAADTTVNKNPKKYLTKQFERLSTPISGKKSRCVSCTRPVLDASSRYCAKCQKRGNANETKGDAS